MAAYFAPWGSSLITKQTPETAWIINIHGYILCGKIYFYFHDVLSV